MKKNVLITISLLLIIIKAQETDTCKSLTTKENCNKDENCEWTEGKCTGDSGTTCSSVKSSSTCPTTTYIASTTKPCTFTPESAEGTCTKPEGAADTLECSTTASSKADCAEGCTWTPTDAATCTGHANCEAVKSPTESTCQDTTVSTTANCAWDATVGSCASRTKSDNEGEEEEEEEKSDGSKTDGGKTDGSGSGSGTSTGTGTGTGTGNTSGSGSDSAFGLKFSGLIYLLLALF